MALCVQYMPRPALVPQKKTKLYLQVRLRAHRRSKHGFSTSMAAVVVLVIISLPGVEFPLLLSGLQSQMSPEHKVLPSDVELKK